MTILLKYAKFVKYNVKLVLKILLNALFVESIPIEFQPRIVNKNAHVFQGILKIR